MGNWWRATYRYWRWIFFIQEFPLAFVGSMLAGLGIGLVITALLRISLFFKIRRYR